MSIHSGVDRCKPLGSKWDQAKARKSVTTKVAMIQVHTVAEKGRKMTLHFARGAGFFAKKHWDDIFKKSRVKQSS